jgi:hypothetical protein
MVFCMKIDNELRIKYVSKIIYSSTITNMAMVRITAAKIRNAFTLVSSVIRMIHFYDHPHAGMA